MSVEMDVLCELASEIVERQWDIDNHPKPHSYTADNGDLMYIEEVQDEFNRVLDLIDNILNPTKPDKKIDYVGMMYELRMWEEIKEEMGYEQSDDNDGLVYGIYWLDEDAQCVDVEWFRTEEERHESVRKASKQSKGK